MKNRNLYLIVAIALTVAGAGLRLAIAEDKPQAKGLSPHHGVRTLGFLLASDLGDDSFDALVTQFTGENAKELKLKEFGQIDGKTVVTGSRLITLKPATSPGGKALEVKIRDFTGILETDAAKIKEILELAKKSVPYQSEANLPKSVEANPGKVFELHHEGDASAPERCFSAPRGMVRLVDNYGRDYAGSYNECYMFNRQTERAYGQRCSMSWEPRFNISTYGCRCIF